MIGISDRSDDSARCAGLEKTGSDWWRSFAPAEDRLVADQLDGALGAELQVGADGEGVIVAEEDARKRLEDARSAWESRRDEAEGERVCFIVREKGRLRPAN